MTSFTHSVLLLLILLFFRLTSKIYIFTGDVRSVNANFIDGYLLKSLDYINAGSHTNAVIRNKHGKLMLKMIDPESVKKGKYSKRRRSNVVVIIIVHYTSCNYRKNYFYSFNPLLMSSL